VAWSSWEGETVSVEGPAARPDKFADPDFALAFARIECEPLAAIERSVQVLVVGRAAYPPPPPPADEQGGR